MSTSGRREREAEEGSFNTQEEDAAEAQTVTQEGPHHTPGSRISKFRVKVNLPPISSVPLESQEGGEMEPEGRWDPYSASCCDGYINCWELVEESDEVFLGCRSSEDARSGPVGCFQCASGLVAVHLWTMLLLCIKLWHRLLPGTIFAKSGCERVEG